MSETEEERKIREALEREAEEAKRKSDRQNPAEGLGKIRDKIEKKRRGNGG